jgi:hypothetical protein
MAPKIIGGIGGEGAGYLELFLMLRASEFSVLKFSVQNEGWMLQVWNVARSTGHTITFAEP